MKRKFQRLSFYLLKFFISRLVYINSRVYMKYYEKLLRTTGLTLNGQPRFIAVSARFDDFNLITLGDRLVVSMNVMFLTHDYSFTTGLIAIDQMPKTDIGILGPINIGNNVFIGMNSIILPGTTIGNNVIVGAGSIVRGTFPDNVVISGNPAKIINDIQSHTEKIINKDYLKVVDSK